jgi:hypothetical protein
MRADAAKTARAAPVATALAIIASVLAFAATPAHAASTRAEYIAQVDPICASASSAEKRAQGGIGHLIKKDRFKAAARKFRLTNRAFGLGVEQVAAVAPPAADAQVIATWVQMLRAQLPLAEKAAKALADGQIGKAIARLFRASDNTKAYIAGYGFSACADF